MVCIRDVPNSDPNVRCPRRWSQKECLNINGWAWLGRDFVSLLQIGHVFTISIRNHTTPYLLLQPKSYPLTLFFLACNCTLSTVACIPHNYCFQKHWTNTKKRHQTSNPSEQQISKDCWQPKLVLPNFVDTSDITEHIGSDEEHMWSVEINVEFQEMCFHTRDGPPIPSTSLILDMVVRKLTDCEEGDEKVFLK